jgi:hypothetical protein
MAILLFETSVGWWSTSEGRASVANRQHMIEAKADFLLQELQHRL